jgi:hypothetical protein
MFIGVEQSKLQSASLDSKMQQHVKY